eukprot:COSAG02_NODE_444_length_22204_cov_21.041167_5_plen_214_part_00
MQGPRLLLLLLLLLLWGCGAVGLWCCGAASGPDRQRLADWTRRPLCVRAAGALPCWPCRHSTSRAFLQSRSRCPRSKGMSWAAAGGSNSSRKTQWRSPAPVAASTPHAALRLGSLARDQLKSRHVCADFMRSIVRDSANAIGPSGLISKKRRQVCLALCAARTAPPPPPPTHTHTPFIASCALCCFLGRAGGSCDRDAATRWPRCHAAARRSN